MDRRQPSQAEGDVLVIVVFGGGSDIAKALDNTIPNVIRVLKLVCDVRIPLDVASALWCVKGVDAVVNCAGRCVRTGFDTHANMEPSDVNFVGSYNVIHSTHLYAPKAKIVLLSSEVAYWPDPDKPMYAASKAAVNSLVKSAAKAGMNVYAVAPTRVNTKMSAHIHDGKQVWQPMDVAKEIKNCIDGKYEPGSIVRMRHDGNIIG